MQARPLPSLPVWLGKLSLLQGFPYMSWAADELWGMCTLYFSTLFQLLPHSGREVFSFQGVCRGVYCWISSDQITKAVARGLHWCVEGTGVAPKVGMKPLCHAALTMPGFPWVSLLPPCFLIRGSFTSQALGVLFALDQKCARYPANNSTA